MQVCARLQQPPDTPHRVGERRQQGADSLALEVTEDGLTEPHGIRRRQWGVEHGFELILGAIDEDVRNHSIEVQIREAPGLRLRSGGNCLGKQDALGCHGRLVSLTFTPAVLQ